MASKQRVAVSINNAEVAARWRRAIVSRAGSLERVVEVTRAILIVSIKMYIKSTERISVGGQTASVKPHLNENLTSIKKCIYK